MKLLIKAHNTFIDNNSCYFI